MGLEVASYINDLVTTNPVGGDLLSQADDHIRLLKTVLKASLPKDLRGVATPSNYVPLRYDGTSFKNYNNGCYTNLAMTQNLALAPSTSNDVTYQSEIQDDLGLYGGAGSNLVIPANFPTGAFGIFVNLVITNPSSLPSGGIIRLQMTNVTSSSRNPMSGLASKYHDIYYAPSSAQPTTQLHQSVLLFLLPHNITRVQVGDVLRFQINPSFTCNIINGNLIAFVL